jgi:hypothetical protein
MLDSGGRLWRRIWGVDVDLDKLTVILASRMAAIVPAGFNVEAADGMLRYSADEGRFPGQLGNYRVGRSGTHVRGNFDVHGQTDEDRIAGVAAYALDQLQDYIDEATHDPWPGERAQPRAYAQVRDRTLHLWYGGPDIDSDAVLACEPIPLAHLGR